MGVLNKIILHPKFRQTIEDLNSNNIHLPQHPIVEQPHIFLNQEGNTKLTNVEEIKEYKLNATAGSENVHKYKIAAYDESIQKYDALEGNANFTAHSLVLMDKMEYIPVCLATFYFYTRSTEIKSKSDNIRPQRYLNDKGKEETGLASDKDYVKDKCDFLIDNTPNSSLLFVDGPIIGGDYFTEMIRANKKLLDKEIIPIFIVKNSTTNIVTENIQSLMGKYNSDMHWIYKNIKAGSRSNFFRYEDLYNKSNTRTFCYIKAFDLSPIRVEMHSDTYSLYKEHMKSIMDIIYYLLLVQGSKTNPQVRCIAIAEQYARAVLKFIDVHKQFSYMNITPTMNQGRGFGG